jgi:hypothetical protein
VCLIAVHCGRFGDRLCNAASAFLAQLVLPYDQTSPNGSKAALTPAKEKNKGGRPRNNAASVIYASALRDALVMKPHLLGTDSSSGTHMQAHSASDT